ncbi:MAG: non-canonical purine NTP pyrophosphatase, RdgB/HAM1 family [Acidobacteria bacterium]|nr:MAG: non-canonical purine NTP pyrophosphatase, RdgB/HAM1 family [Acidobacteriota bacterium]
MADLTKEILLASGNQGKLREMKEIASTYHYRIVSLKELGLKGDAPETGQTFLENARQKAEYYFKKTGLPVIADDSGLEVDALNGAPGIHSARYGGLNTEEERRAWLLHQLTDVPDPQRRARFRSVAVYMDQHGCIHASGTAEGFILRQEKGSGGFGYDPVFSTSLSGPTYAEITQEEKNRTSHRGQAFRKLFALLANKEQADRQASTRQAAAADIKQITRNGHHGIS